MDSKKPVILNDLEEWDFTGYNRLFNTESNNK